MSPFVCLFVVSLPLHSGLCSESPLFHPCSILYHLTCSLWVSWIPVLVILAQTQTSCKLFLFSWGTLNIAQLIFLDLSSTWSRICPRIFKCNFVPLTAQATTLESFLLPLYPYLSVESHLISSHIFWLCLQNISKMCTDFYLNPLPLCGPSLSACPALLWQPLVWSVSSFTSLSLPEEWAG